MPHASPVPCRAHGCGQLAVRRIGYCSAHEHIGQQRKAEWKKRHDAQRESARKRGYDGAWERLRKRKLAASPVCEHCNRYLASEVDHITPIADGGARLAWDNLHSLCGTCHRRKTGQDVRKRRQKHAAEGTKPARTAQEGRAATTLPAR